MASSPPKRAGGPARSRWLREDDDKGWEARQGRYNSGARSGGVSYGEINNGMILGNGLRQEVQNQADNANPLNFVVQNGQAGRENSNLTIDNGPDNEEMDGLQISERKRLRGGPGNYDVMDTPGGLAKVADSELNNNSNDIVLSNQDYAMLNTSQLAQLA